VLVASSQLPELLQLCDRIAVVCCGVVLPPRPVHELDETRLLAAMTGAFA
jgi:ribose transport system ATP-binding protein